MKTGDWVVFKPEFINDHQQLHNVDMRKPYKIKDRKTFPDANTILDLDIGVWNVNWFLKLEELSLLERAIHGIKE